MANEIDSQSIGLGDVAPRPVIKKHLDIFANALNKIDEKSKEALKQRTAIQTALSQIDLDSSEDEWKAAYARNIQDQIDDMARGGDYSSALNLATQLAGDAISSPELTSRIRTHNQREEAVKVVDARNDLHDDTKLRFKEQNSYEYKPIYDNDGRVVGSEKWQAKWNPVKDVDVPELVKYTIGIAQADTKQRGEQHATGNTTCLADGSSSGYSRSNGSSNSRTILSKDKLLKSAEGTYIQNAAAIQQDYENKVWKLDKLKKQRDALPITEQGSLDREIHAIESQVCDANGIPLGNGKSMFFYQIDPSLDAAAYSKIVTEVSTSDTTQSNEATNKGTRGSGSGGTGNGGLQLLAGTQQDGVVETEQQSLFNTPWSKGRFPSGNQIGGVLNGNR